MNVGDLISIKDNLVNLIKMKSSFKKLLEELNMKHYLFTVETLKYNFEVYNSFNISYFSKDSNLLKNYADDQELMDYESLEDTTNDVAIILINKFKLRISFSKSTKVSRDFIICDTYELNPDILGDDSSLIKVALVKDNYNEWINSGNLNSYDYVFTLNEYFDEFDRDNVFIINEETIYKQIKHILNELYNNHLYEFYEYLKRINFQKTFPKWDNYFNILNSELFDDDWYRKTYDLEENTDSAIHYLLIGKKGYDPSPNFSSSEYLECNKDVKRSGMNPLIHYELYGRDEGRLIWLKDKYERDYSIILNSPCFDKVWYENTYDIGDDDAVNHYLKTGFLKGYNPGPNFSSYEYLECNKDVKEEGENPLIHFEVFGRKENRKYKFSDEETQEYLSLILNSPCFDRFWYEDTYDIGDDDAVSHYLKIGYAKGYDPSPNFSTNEYYECNQDVMRSGMNPLIHYELYGRDEGRLIWLKDKYERDYSIILNSPCFDRFWYEDTYDIGDDDAVSHYLKIGHVKYYNPGPNFSTYEYLEFNRDVKQEGENPLVHFELFGKREHRKYKFSDKEYRNRYSAIFNSPFFDEGWYKSTYKIDNAVDCIDHYLKVGYTKGYNPGPDFDSFEYWQCNEDVKEHGMNPLVHYEVYGRDEKRKISLSEVDKE